MPHFCLARQSSLELSTRYSRQKLYGVQEFQLCQPSISTKNVIKITSKADDLYTTNLACVGHISAMPSIINSGHHAHPPARDGSFVTVTVSKHTVITSSSFVAPALNSFGHSNYRDVVTHCDSFDIVTHCDSFDVVIEE